MTSDSTMQPRPSGRQRVTGWVVFASVLLIVAGVVNVINGGTLLEHHSFYSNHVFYGSNLDFWGWVFIIWGAVQLVAGILAWRGNLTGNLIGVVVGSAGAVLWFFLIFSATGAAVVGIGLNMLVVYALTAGAHPDDWEM